MRWLAIFLFLLIATTALADAGGNSGRSDAPREPAQVQQKVDDLARLLRDPDLRSWAETQSGGLLPPRNPGITIDNQRQDDSVASKASAWESQTRGKIGRIVAAVPQIPFAFRKALSQLYESATEDGFTARSVLMLTIVAVASISELLIRNQVRRHGGGLGEFNSISIFALGMTLVFFSVDWPPLLRVVVACYVSAFAAYRLLSTVARLTWPRHIHRRLEWAFGLTLAAIGTVEAASMLSVDQTILQAAAFLVSLFVLALAGELVWARRSWRVPAKLGLTIYVIATWLFWITDLKTLFWILVYAVVLPAILYGITHAVRNHLSVHMAIAPSDNRNVLVVRGARAVVIGIAIAWIVSIWKTDGQSALMTDPRIDAIFYGILKSVIVLLLADLAWHLAKAAIDRNFGSDDGAGSAHATRLCTLLPILRNVLAVALSVVSGMIVLSQLGVEIAPLIAGAGIFGVALGFGSQALVKDVISGFFYLFDDAFRMGEYIQAKNYKGTVEGFSLRSVRLRHSRGPIFTIPFGELGAVENMSRGWSKTKITVTVPYDTDLEKARKIGKAIGQDLINDSEIGKLFIEPLKMKGVEDFGEYGVVISYAMITVPSDQQSFIRRTAYAMLREAFQKNGVAFAQPTIMVGGGEQNPAGTAVAAQAQHLAGVKIDAVDTVQA